MDDKRPLDLALDLLVYAPVGLAVSVREVLPKLAAQGRDRLADRVGTARVVGRFAVQHGQARADQAFSRAREEALRRLDARGEDPSPPATDPVAVPAEAPAVRSAGDPAAAGDLAIPGYDSLSASQVLPRLEGLATAELEAVRAYETAHRGRKTILGRISQLQSAP